MKDLHLVRIKKITAYPLDDKGHCDDRDFFIAVAGSGHKVPTTNRENLLSDMKEIAIKAFSKSRLSYIYSPGDTTAFIVKYRIDTKSSVREFTFVTGVL